MPKQKTHSSSEEEVQGDGHGEADASAAQKSGKLMHKSPKQKRQFSKDQPVDSANEKAVDRMLGRR